ncbi:MAG: M20 family metallo-hydrolase [Tunicatimonas sp.]
MSTPDQLTQPAVALLQQLIKTSSFSREEHPTATILQQYLEQSGKSVHRQDNNVWAFSQDYRSDRPTLLLNSHHDTVRPTASWTRDPFSPAVRNGKLYGLGSNDAGGALVALLHTFLYLDERPRSYNLLFAATAEEEISGANGIASIMESVGPIALGIVGEPTQMEMAVAEKGLMVLDCEARGLSGHAARHEGVNAIYAAIQDIRWIQEFHFPEKSDLLGEVSTCVTQIEAGTQHNVVPDRCTFVVDVRTNERYTNERVLEIIDHNTVSQVTPRSLRLNSSSIALDHPLVRRGTALGLVHYGSPTLSDQALLKGFPTLKLGPGKSERSHTADEYIKVSEIEHGIATYCQLLDGLELS